MTRWYKRSDSNWWKLSRFDRRNIWHGPCDEDSKLLRAVCPALPQRTKRCHAK